METYFEVTNSETAGGDIVKALYKNNQILKKVFGLLAIEQRRGQDVLYRMVRNDFTFVLKRLQIVSSLSDNNSMVDRMWERLLELAFFAVTKTHRKPVEILKGFISRKALGGTQLDRPSEKLLRQCFSFLKTAYKTTSLSESRLANDQTHFYILATSILNSEWLTDKRNHQSLAAKLAKLGKVVDGKSQVPRQITSDFGKYMELSKKQTTDVSKRKDRVVYFNKMVEVL